MTKCDTDSRHRLTKFSLGKLLGQGTFGKVYLGKTSLCVASSPGKNPKGFIAIKRAPKWTTSMSREVSMLQRVGRHENIVPLLDVFYTRADNATNVVQNLVFPFYSSSLGAFIRKYRHERTRIPPPLLRKLCCDLVRGVAALHEKGVVHRDLKPDNVLAQQPDPNDSNNTTLRVCDLGSAKSIEDGKSIDSMTYICSRYYRAPELLMACQRYDSQVDVWSLGCILLELLILQPIFPGVKPATVKTRTKKPGSQNPGADEPYQLLKIAELIGAPTAAEAANLADMLGEPARNSKKSMSTVRECILALPQAHTSLPRLDFEEVFREFVNGDEEESNLNEMELIHVASSCLRWCPDDRPTATQLLKDFPYLQL